MPKMETEADDNTQNNEQPAIPEDLSKTKTRRRIATRRGIGSLALRSGKMTLERPPPPPGTETRKSVQSAHRPAIPFEFRAPAMPSTESQSPINSMDSSKHKTLSVERSDDNKLNFEKDSTETATTTVKALTEPVEKTNILSDFVDTSTADVQAPGLVHQQSLNLVRSNDGDLDDNDDDDEFIIGERLVVAIAKVLFSYKARSDLELDIDQNEEVNVLELDENNIGWTTIEKNGVEGLVPTSYLRIDEVFSEGSDTESAEVDNDESTEADGSNEEFLQAIASYVPKAKGELAFRKGDILLLVIYNVTPGWHEAILNGKSGKIPATLVKNYKKIM